jgi:Ras-related protein Rab-18
LLRCVGVDFKVKMMVPASTKKKVKITIWDTAGQERFRTLTSSYYRGAQGIILVYDVSKKDTFESLDQWLREMEVYCPGGGREVVKLLVGNKVDKSSVVSREEAEDWARSRGMLFLESSAKTDVGITQAFEEVVEKILENPVLLLNTAPGKPSGGRVGLGNQQAQAQTVRGGCC